MFLGSVVAPTGGIHFQKSDFLKSPVPRLRSCPYRGKPFSEIQLFQNNTLLTEGGLLTEGKADFWKEYFINRGGLLTEGEGYACIS